MTAKGHSSEKGQALILIVLGMVALFGFTALAIDGGMAYSDRRHAQNAVDASSLAGAAAAGKFMEDHALNYLNWSCPGGLTNALNAAENAAISRGSDNGFTIGIAGTNRVEANCGQVSHAAWYDRYIDIYTTVTRDTETSFAHFVYAGDVRNTVEAIARIRPRTPLAFGHAIVALNEADCQGNQNGIQFGGSSTTTVKGGGIFSNGCIDGDGNQFSTTVQGAGINYAGQHGNNMSGYYPTPVMVNETMPRSAVSVPLPSCSSLTHKSQSGNTLDPGIYTSISQHNGALTLNPGLYCITGSNNAFSVNGGDLTANGVTLYFTNEDARMSINGSGAISMTAPAANPDPSPALPGILIYSLSEDAGAVNIEGNSGSTYSGTIYVPNGDISVSGASGQVAFQTQLIGLDVFVAGNALIDITYNGPQNYSRPSFLELYK